MKETPATSPNNESRVFTKTPKNDSSYTRYLRATMGQEAFFLRLMAFIFLTGFVAVFFYAAFLPQGKMSDLMYVRNQGRLRLIAPVIIVGYPLLTLQLFLLYFFDSEKAWNNHWIGQRAIRGEQKCAAYPKSAWKYDQERGHSKNAYYYDIHRGCMERLPVDAELFAERLVVKRQRRKEQYWYLKDAYKVFWGAGLLVLRFKDEYEPHDIVLDVSKMSKEEVSDLRMFLYGNLPSWCRRYERRHPRRSFFRERREFCRHPIYDRWDYRIPFIQQKGEVAQFKTLSEMHEFYTTGRPPSFSFRALDSENQYVRYLRATMGREQRLLYLLGLFMGVSLLTILVIVYFNNFGKVPGMLKAFDKFKFEVVAPILYGGFIFLSMRGFLLFVVDSGKVWGHRQGGQKIIEAGREWASLPKKNQAISKDRNYAKNNYYYDTRLGCMEHAPVDAGLCGDRLIVEHKRKKDEHWYLKDVYKVFWGASLLVLRFKTEHGPRDIVLDVSEMSKEELVELKAFLYRNLPLWCRYYEKRFFKNPFRRERREFYKHPIYDRWDYRIPLLQPKGEIVQFKTISEMNELDAG